MYKKINDLKDSYELYADKLISEGIITKEYKLESET
jgi:hypothetical protein